MAYGSSPSNYRRLTFFLAIVVFFQNIGTAYLLHRLPDDPMDMSSHLSFYSWFASMLAFLGVLGAKKENATLVAIFANFLLIDVVLCSIPRILTMFFFPEIRGSICSPDSIDARLQAFQARGFFNTQESQEQAEQQMMAECTTVIMVLQVFAGLVVAGATLMQVLLALRVRAYSCMLQQRQDIEEASSNDGHYDDSEKRAIYESLHSSQDTQCVDEKTALDA